VLISDLLIFRPTVPIPGLVPCSQVQIDAHRVSSLSVTRPSGLLAVLPKA